MNEIEDAIGKVEILYRTLTGRDAPQVDVPYAPIPAEQDPAQHVQEQMDRLMSLLGGAPREPSLGRTIWTPTMSVWESQRELLVSIDLPGVKRDQLEVGLQGSVVVVTGRRLPPETEQDDAPPPRPRSAEQPYGTFRRVIPLPPTVQRDQMSASLKDGVLCLRLPTETVTAPRSITVS
jgi:HSP20 family protein